MYGKRERAGACRNCRVRKKRCISTGSTKSCQRCQVLSVPCNLGGTSPLLGFASTGSLQKQPNTSPLQVLCGSNVTSRDGHLTLLPTGALLFEVIELYFRFIHNGPHTLFHKPSFWSEVNSGNIPEMILFGMIALAIRFSKQDCFSKHDPCTRGLEFAEEARRLIHLQMMNPSLETVQACILVGQFFGGEGDAKAKHIYLGIARLHAQTIRLWEISQELCSVSQEIRRRTWLSVTIANTWSAADISTQPVLYDISTKPILDDIEFMALQPGAHHNIPPSKNSMWAQMAGTIDIYRQISHMISNLGLNLRSLDSYREQISSLSQQLDEWIGQLPEKLQYSVENLAYFTATGLGSTFVGVHMGYHHCRQLLYYPFLNSGSLRSVDHPCDGEMARRCKQHAISISDITKAAFQAGESNAAYFLTGHILVVSSSIHLHTLLLGDDLVEADMAHKRLVSNFEILMLLKMYWPVVDSSVARLRAFQNSCRQSISHSFILDNWMLKFLIEHTAKFGPDSRPTAELSPPQVQPESRSSNVEASMIPPEFGTFSEIPVANIDGSVSLTTLLQDKDWSDEVMVENALSWLLDQNVPVSEYWLQ